ncbi:unnamed protein product, partial [Discosporangium mesarthrocarpum]
TSLLDVRNSIFRLNSGCVNATSWTCTGGGAYVSGPARILVNGSIFEGNAALNAGGMVAMNDYELLVSGTLFKGNMAEYFGGGFSALGGGTFEFLESNFTGGWARNGGAGATIENQQTGHFYKCFFFGNEVAQEGGGLSVRDGANVLVEQTIFTNNTATTAITESTGAGLNVYQAMVDVVDSVFEGNNAQFPEEFSPLDSISGGGAVGLDGANGSFSRCNFTANTGEHGGAVFAERKSLVYLSNSILSDNYAQKWGGAVSIHENSFLEVNDTSFTQNSAGLGGGALHTHASRAYLEDAAFRDNSASGSGGALAVMESSNLTCAPCPSMVDNRASNNGGAVLAEGGNTNFVMLTPAVPQPKSTGSDTPGVVGGGSYGTVISMNSAVVHGGGVHVGDGATAWLQG